MADLAKGDSPDKWTATNLKYKIDGDRDLPKNRQGLLEQYEKTKNRDAVDVDLDAIVEEAEAETTNATASTSNVSTNLNPAENGSTSRK
jgi:hypothetical protein